MGRGGFEPPKSSTADLQSAPFGRSGTCPLDIKLWSWWLESNPQPADYKSAALPVELHQQSVIKTNLGASGRNRTTDTGIFSPLLYRLSYRGIQVIFWKCLLLNKHFQMATRKGLEPSTSSVTGWRTNHLYYRAKLILFFWWAFTDSNRGPIGYEPTALTYWAKGP